MLFLTYFGTCSVYTVIIAKNFLQVIEFYIGYEVDIRVCISLLLIPLILLSWVPNLKYLAPFSSVANVFMGIGLLITFYYCVTDMPSISERELHTSLLKIPPFFGIVIFAMEAVSSHWKLMQIIYLIFLTDWCRHASRKFNENSSTFYRHLWCPQSRHGRCNFGVYPSRFLGICQVWNCR